MVGGFGLGDKLHAIAHFLSEICASLLFSLYVLSAFLRSEFELEKGVFKIDVSTDKKTKNNLIIEFI